VKEDEEHVDATIRKEDIKVDKRGRSDTRLTLDDTRCIRSRAEQQACPARVDCGVTDARRSPGRRNGRDDEHVTERSALVELRDDWRAGQQPLVHGARLLPVRFSTS
jgi:hypothetical protein